MHGPDSSGERLGLNYWLPWLGSAHRLHKRSYSVGSVTPTTMSLPQGAPCVVGVGSTRTSAPVWGAST